MISRSDFQSRADWLAARTANPYQIGASDWATILGRNKFESAFSWFHRKRDRIEIAQSLPMELGIELEPFIIRKFIEQTGRAVVTGYFTFTHSDYDFLSATPDGLIDGALPLECKMTGALEDQLYVYNIQQQAQIACMCVDSGALAILETGWRKQLTIFDNARNDEWINAALPRIIEMHDRLLNNDPPPIDGSESTARALAMLHPRDTGEVVQGDGHAMMAIRELLIIKAQIKQYEEYQAEHENRIKNTIADATTLDCDGYSASWKFQTRAGQIVVPDDARPVLDAHGIPYEIKGASEFRVLRVKEVKQRVRQAT